MSVLRHAITIHKNRVIRIVPTAGACGISQYLSHGSGYAYFSTTKCVQDDKLYKYSMDSGVLTGAERDFFEENGFLVKKKLVSEDDIDLYKKQFLRICAGEIKVPEMVWMRDVAIEKNKSGQREEHVVTRIQNFQNEPTLFRFSSHRKIVDYVCSIIGQNAMCLSSVVVNKPPDTGKKTSRHPMHQDLLYFPIRPANKIVGVWTAMEHVYRDNGCLSVVPGTHKGGLQEHEYPKWEGGVNKMYLGVKGYDPSLPRHYVEMEQGDTLFFHPLLYHGSGANTTNGFRKAIICHYVASDCEYIDVSGTIQEPLAKESIEVHNRKFGKDFGVVSTFTELWRRRARLVSGRTGNI